MKPKQRLIQKPDLPEELLIRSLNELTDNSFIEMAKYDHTSSSFTASHVGFEDVFFTNVNMSQSKFPFSSWTNVLFDTCDLSQLDFQGARFRRVEFRNCKLAGVNFSQTDMQDVRFIACEAPYTLFGNAILRDGELVDCLLKGSQFIDTKLDYAQLDNVVLDDVSFDFTSLKGMDLRSCSFTNIHLSEKELRGAIISPEQAISFIHLFGVTVKQT